MTVSKYYRLDVADRPLTLRSMTVDEDTGFARITGVVAAPGELDYPELGFTEKVGARALADAEANDTLRGAPVVVLHPTENGGRVDVSNVSWLRVGTVLDVRWDPETQELLYEAQIEDADTIAQIVEARKTQGAPDTLADCSPGYDVLVKDGDEQVKRKYNHLALVPYGRGDRARIYLDAKPHEEREDMKPEEMKAMLDALREDMREDMKGMIDGMREDMYAKAREDMAEEHRKDMEEKEKAQADNAHYDMDEEEKERRMDALVTARAEQRRVVAEVAERVGVEFRADANVFANMSSILEAKVPAAFRADMSRDEISAAFAAYSATVPTEPAPSAEQGRFDGFGAFAPTPASAQRADGKGETLDIDSVIAEMTAAHEAARSGR